MARQAIESFRDTENCSDALIKDYNEKIYENSL